MHFPSMLVPHVPSYAQWRDAQAPKQQSKHVQSQDKPVYRWRDKHGQTHISDTPPKGVRAERVHINPNTNIVPLSHPRTTNEVSTDNEILEVID